MMSSFNRLLVLLFLLPAPGIVELQAQPLSLQEPGKNPDTICFPYYAGLRMIMVDHEGQRRRNVDWHEMTRPRAMSWDALIPPSPLNEYFFLDSSGKVVMSFNAVIDNKNESRFQGYQCPPVVTPNPKDWDIRRSLAWRGSREGFHNVKYGENPAAAHYRVSSGSNVRQKGRFGRVDTTSNIGLIDAGGRFILPMKYAYIEVAGEFFLVLKNGACGLIRKNLEEVIPVQYKRVEKPREGLYVFSNASGPQVSFDITTLQKEDLRMFDWVDQDGLDDNAREGRPIVLYRKGDKMGFVSRRLKKVTEPIYDYAVSYFRDGLAPVCRGGKWGYVDASGKEKIPVEYEDAVPFENGFAKVRLGGRVFCINTRGEETGDGNCAVYYVIEEEPRWRDERLDGMNIKFVKRNNFYGGMDKAGNVLVPFIYESVHCVSELEGARKCRKDFFQVQKGNKWGIIRKNGSVLIPCIYDEIRDYAGQILVTMKNELADNRGDMHKVGLLTRDFEWLFPCEYESLNPNIIPGTVRFSKAGLFGVMTFNGKIIIPAQYQDIGWMKNGLSPVKKDGKYGMIDSLGRVMVPIQYEAVGGSFSNNRLPVKMNGKWGYIDSLLNLIVPCIYETVYSFEKPVAQVRTEKASYFINLQGEKLGDEEYEFIAHQWSPDGLIAVRKNNKFGFADETGKLVIPCIYEDVSGYNLQGHRVKKGGQWMHVKRPG